MPDRRGAASIAKMRRNKLRLLNGSAKPFCCLQNDKMMAVAMESIPPNPVLLVVFVGNRVMKSMSRQRLVKRSAEHHHLRLIGEKLRGDANPLASRRIVKRGQLGEFLDSSHHAFGNQHRSAKIFSAMDNPMPDGFDIYFVAPPEKFDDPQKSGPMIGPRDILLVADGIQIDHFQFRVARQQTLGNA